ncbi:hypothetical protein HLV37_01410 [Eggerthellaceae bacterium zg-1084]|nr:hypothetical protein [Berryella wangjianweii]NPD32244.1 hypothetical protein [Eggerthellaceae bacterium zg-997]
MSDKGRPYKSQFFSVYQSGNVKFIMRRNENEEEPMETMTLGRVYVLVDKHSSAVKSIYYFDENGKRTKQIDLGHAHNGVKPHAHRGYNHQEYDRHEKRLNLSNKERKMVDRALKTWDYAYRQGLAYEGVRS